MKKNEELQIQAAVVDFFEINKILIFSVPNGQNIPHPVTRALLKESGLRAGVSDLIAVLDGEVVFIEMKTKTGRQRPEQKEFEAAVKARGFEYVIFRSVSDAEKWLLERKAAGKATR